MIGKTPQHLTKSQLFAAVRNGDNIYRVRIQAHEQDKHANRYEIGDAALYEFRIEKNYKKTRIHIRACQETARH